MRLALTTLCEHPRRQTGLTTFFRGLVGTSLKQYPDLEWVVFLGPDVEWPINDPRVQLVRHFPANDKLFARLYADHFEVPPAAKQLGADALLTIGFVPIRKTLPTVLTLISMQHVDPTNRIGFARQSYRRFMTQMSLNRADLVITNSDFALAQIRTAFPDLTTRIVISPEGFDLELWRREKLPNEEEELEKQIQIQPGYFLWVSNFYPYKQAELLIEGYARLDPDLRSKHPLVMVGGGWEGGDSSALSRARELGVESNVRFLGWIDERWLAPLYRNALAFCLASREETFGKIVIEAMACGTPCIVNDIPIMHEVTAGHAVIVDFRQTDKVAAALRQIACEPALREQLCAAGLRRAAEFTFERMSRERIDAINELVTDLQK